MTDPRVLLRSAALDQGFSDGELARAVRRQELHLLQRGAYVDVPRPPRRTGTGPS
ncbi:hypothetical protein [Modestobacter versicolor]|uniref:hypothetical protein n=1 Tax=Modestobacter versicolor TaxID=429133 RepID=UPI0034DE00BD